MTGALHDWRPSIPARVLLVQTLYQLDDGEVRYRVNVEVDRRAGSVLRNSLRLG
jgi:hypothetical protein